MGGTCSRATPQSALFDINDAAEKCTNGPLVGISPLSLLKETFRYLRCKSASKDMGISPDKLLFERSKCSKLTDSPKVAGIEPSYWEINNERLTSVMSPPMLIGISPDR